MQVIITIFTKDFSSNKEISNETTFIPRVGERLILNEKTNDTNNYLVIDIVYLQGDNETLYPNIKCVPFFEIEKETYFPEIANNLASAYSV